MTFDNIDNHPDTRQHKTIITDDIVHRLSLY